MDPSYIIWNIDPVAFSIGPISPRWYGLLFALGFILSYQIMRRVFVREHRQLEKLDRLTMYMIVGTILGARLGHCLFYDPAFYLTHPLKILAFWEGGLASHGGAIGIFTALWLFAKRKNFSLIWLLDRIALVVPLAGACIRFGNLMNSEILGTPTTVPWAFIFARIDMQPRHPAQLYEAICYLLLFIVLYLLYNKSTIRQRAGALFGAAITGIFTFRFLIEFVKEHQAVFAENLPLSMGQLLSIPFIIIGIIFLVRGYNNPPKDDPPPEARHHGRKKRGKSH